MPDVSVTFVHPTDGRALTVTVDDTMTAQESIGELLANDFVPPHQQGYQLSVVESGAIMRPEQSFADAGVKNGTKIKVLPITEAGR